MEGKFIFSGISTLLGVIEFLLFSIGIPIDDTYFTLDRDWSLLSFLLYRQQCDDFLADKCSEHKRYIHNLSAIINCEDLPETAIERAGVALTSMQAKYFLFFLLLVVNGSEEQ